MHALFWRFLAREVKSNSLNSATNLLHVSQMPDKIFLWHWNSDSNFTKRKNAEKNEVDGVSFCSASERAILDLMHRQSIFCTIQMQALQKGSYAKKSFRSFKQNIFRLSKVQVCNKSHYSLYNQNPDFRRVDINKSFLDN